jgi:hypothetical protein
VAENSLEFIIFTENPPRHLLVSEITLKIFGASSSSEKCRKRGFRQLGYSRSYTKTFLQLPYALEWEVSGRANKKWTPQGVESKERQRFFSK